jgi:hypothetical protein
VFQRSVQAILLSRNGQRVLLLRPLSREYIFGQSPFRDIKQANSDVHKRKHRDVWLTACSQANLGLVHRRGPAADEGRETGITERRKQAEAPTRQQLTFLKKKAIQKIHRVTK